MQRICLVESIHFTFKNQLASHFFKPEFLVKLVKYAVHHLLRQHWSRGL